MTPRRRTDSLYHSMNQFTMSLTPISTSISNSVPIIFRLRIVFSNPSSVASNNSLTALLSSVCASTCFSSNSPYSPVVFFASSRLVFIWSKLSIICKPCAAPFRPNTSFSTLPTSSQSGGNSLMRAEIILMTSMMEVSPLLNSCSICFELSPIASSDFFALSDICLMRTPAI